MQEKHIFCEAPKLLRHWLIFLLDFVKKNAEFSCKFLPRKIHFAIVVFAKEAQYHIHELCYKLTSDYANA